MTFDQKATLLYEYIVGGVSTTRMADYLRSNYSIYIDHDEYESVFIEYNINYNDRGNGNARGFHRGQHLGKYKNGYTNNKGKTYPVTSQVIVEYMNNYKRTGKNLEQFLSSKFDENDIPVQPTFSQPVYSNPAPMPSNNTRSFEMPQLNGNFPKIIGVIIAIVAAIILFNTIILPAINKASNNFGNEQNKTTSNTSYYDVSTEHSVILSNTLYSVDIDVNFEGKKSDIKEDYTLLVGDGLQGSLQIGHNNKFTAALKEGYHDIWVKSGDKESDMYRVHVDNNGAIKFECKHGTFNPSFKCTDNGVYEVKKLT